MDGQIEALMQLVKPSADKLTVTRDDKLFFLTDTDIFYFESVDRKCFVCTQTDTYESSVVLLELEKTLNQRRFARISKSTIVNLGKVKSIARNFDATMTLELTSGEKMLTTAIAWQGILLSLWFGTCHFIYFAKWPAVRRITLHGLLTLVGTVGMNALFGWISLTGVQWLIALAIFVGIYALTLWSWWIYYRSEEAVLNRKLELYKSELED